MAKCSEAEDRSGTIIIISFWALLFVVKINRLGQHQTDLNACLASALGASLPRAAALSLLAALAAWRGLPAAHHPPLPLRSHRRRAPQIRAVPAARCVVARAGLPSAHVPWPPAALLSVKGRVVKTDADSPCPRPSTPSSVYERSDSRCAGALWWAAAALAAGPQNRSSERACMPPTRPHCLAPATHPPACGARRQSKDFRRSRTAAPQLHFAQLLGAPADNAAWSSNLALRSSIESVSDPPPQPASARAKHEWDAQASPPRAAAELERG